MDEDWFREDSIQYEDLCVEMERRLLVKKNATLKDMVIPEVNIFELDEMRKHWSLGGGENVDESIVDMIAWLECRVALKDKHVI